MFRYGFQRATTENIYSNAWRCVIIPTEIGMGTVIRLHSRLDVMQGLRHYWFELLAAAVIALALFLIAVIVRS